MPTARDGRSVTARVLDILDCFSHANPALTVSEIARAADLTTATASRRVRELADWGALERGQDGRFRVGMRLWELSSLAPMGMPLREKALPFLQDIVDLTGGNAQLAIRTGIEALFIDRLIGDCGVPPRLRIASRLPLTATSVGLTLLAHAPADIQDRALSRPIQASSPQTITDPAHIRRLLPDVRRNGYCLSVGQLVADSYVVGVPITGAEGKVVAALGIVIQEEDVEQKRVIGTGLAIARALSRLLE